VTRRIETQAEQWPQRMAGENALDEGEHFRNRDPEFGERYGPHENTRTVPDLVGGDPSGAVSIRPRAEAGPYDAFVMPDEESGLGYDALVRRSPDGRGYDVLKELKG